MAISKPEPKRKSFSGRARESDWEIIERAASRRELKTSEYLVRAAKTQAEMELAEDSSFSLPADQYEEFLAALNRPASAKPELTKLLSRRPIWESE